MAHQEVWFLVRCGGSWTRVGSFGDVVAYFGGSIPWFDSGNSRNRQGHCIYYKIAWKRGKSPSDAKHI